MFQKAILYGSHLDIAQRMLDYDFICGNTPSVVGIFSDIKTLHKLFRGTKEIIIPSISSREECAGIQADVLINLASFRSSSSITEKALKNNQFKLIVAIAEGIPERETREIITLSKHYPDCVLLGPSTVGGIQSGVLRIANTGGSLDNMLKSKLFGSGSVGFVSKSGGMSNEMYRIISQNSNGIHTGMTIGGDRYPYSSFVDIIHLYHRIPEIKMIVMLGEVGEPSEVEVANLYKQGVFTKPMVAWVTGSSAETLQQEIQFGHAGAKANTEQEQASYKNTYMKECGIQVPENFDTIGQIISHTFEQTCKQSVEQCNTEYNELIVPRLQSIINNLKHRRKTSITSSISDEQGNELLYNKKPITEFLKQGSIAHVIGHLWFKKELPDYALRFINDCIILLADHGPAVSGAHASIITSRAGKDIIDSLIAGLTTIGPRFGGAIEGACQFLYEYTNKNIHPIDCVEEFKKKKEHIPGIGHKIKSQYNPDIRCTHLRSLSSTFPNTRHLQYALALEAITLQKKQSLILNVDGYIAAMLLDLMESLGYSDEEMRMYISSGICNGLFALSRSIGFIAHAVDQKRLGEGLYRSPWDDILYL